MDQRRLSPMSIGDRVARRREALGLEQGAVASRSKLSRAYISRLENGLVGNPKVKDLEQVAAALGVPLAELLAPPSEEYRTYRFSADLESIEREVKGLPDDVAERVLRNFRTALEIAQMMQHGQDN